MAQKGIFMKGRRALRMIHDHYRISETEGSLLELQDLLKVSIKGDNLRSFLMDWEHVLTGMNPVPDIAVLETLFRLQVAKSTAMRDTMTHYNRLDMNHPERNYDFLVSSVRRHLEQQRQSQTRQELQNHLSGGQSAGGAMVGKGTPKGKSARSATPKGERVPSGHCRDWVKKGTCARGDSCPYFHEDTMKGKPNRSPSTGKGQGRGRGQKGGKGKKSRSNSPAGEKKPPCRNHLKGKCTKGDQCPFWHSPPCRFYKGGTCNAGEMHLSPCSRCCCRPGGTRAEGTGTRCRLSS